MAGETYTIKENIITETGGPDQNADWDKLADYSFVIYADDPTDPVGTLEIDYDGANGEPYYALLGDQADTTEFEDLLVYFDGVEGATVVLKNVELSGPADFVGGANVDSFNFVGGSFTSGDPLDVTADLREDDDQVKVANSTLEDAEIILGIDDDTVKIKGEANLDGTHFHLGATGSSTDGDADDDIVKFKPGFTGSLNDTEINGFDDRDVLDLAGVQYDLNDLDQSISAIGYVYDDNGNGGDPQGEFTSGIYDGLVINFAV